MTPSEQYAREVVSYLERLSRVQRSRLRSELTAELADYPEADDRLALEARLGPPIRYATDLAEEMGVRPGRRSRPRGWGWLWVAAASATAGLLLAANLTIPLEPGSFFSPGDFEVAAGGDPFGEWTEVVFHQDQEGEMLSSLHNRAPLSVTITDVGVFPAMVRSDRQLTGWSGLFVQTGEFFERETSPGYGFINDPVSFTESPLVLAPGEERTLAIRTLLTNCEFNTPRASEAHDAAMVTYSYLGLTKVAMVEFPKVFTTSPQVCEAPINRVYPTAEEALADGGVPSWIPADGTDVVLATGEAGTVLNMTTNRPAPAGCSAPTEFPYWAYRPDWAPSQDSVRPEDVLACPENWFWWEPEPGEALIWTETRYPFVAP